MKKRIIILVLCVVTVWSFFQRLNSFPQIHKISIDEVVYLNLAYQLRNNFPAYHVNGIASKLPAGAVVPQYFSDPIFKHPPLFAGTIVLGMVIFKNHGLGFVYFVLLFAVLLIPLTYLLARLFFNEWVGLYSAVLVAFDPVSVICSLKIWPDSTLAFFSILTVYFYLLGHKTSRNIFFIWGGCAAGFAVLTKYTGILPIIMILAISFLWIRPLFKNRVFVLSLLIPAIFLIPWVLWNFSVYSDPSQFFAIKKFADAGHCKKLLVHFLQVGLFASISGFIFSINPLSIAGRRLRNSRTYIISASLLSLALAWTLWPHIIKSLDFTQLPANSWKPGSYAKESFLFYPQKLVEFCLLYTVAWFSLIWMGCLGRNKQIIGVCILFFLIFYSCWGNFQCRYILPAIPFAAILIVKQLRGCLLWLKRKDSPTSNFLYWGLAGVIVAAAAKTFLINSLLCFPNNTCYF